MGFTNRNFIRRTEKPSRFGKIALSNPDILLLDEPTNHLDVDAVEWLENFLKVFEKAHIIISHDRYFLDRTCRRIIEIENGKAVTYVGNYSKFLVERELRREQQQREFENQQAYINKTQEFIRKNLAGQKTKQAKSRRTLLEKMDRFEAVIADKPSGNFKVKKVERAGGNVLSVEDLSIGYGEKSLAQNINFTFHRGECLGIIGGNGTGKTTFLKTIFGQTRELSGKMIWGAKTEIGYYSQQLEDLEDRNEIIHELRRIAPNAENGELRSFLARFLFIGEDVFKLVSTLSGGEKGRLALAKLIYSNVNVLALDEPTNHLDIPSREALEEALKLYQGTILTVSHDRYFLDQIATQIFCFEPGGKVEIFNGNYSEFHDWKASIKIPTASERKDLQVSAMDKKPSLVESENGTILSKNEIQKIQSKITKIEEQIAKLESSGADFGRQMGLPEIASDHSKLQKVTDEFNDIQERIKALYEEWEVLSDALS